MQYLFFEILSFLILSFVLGFITSWALWGSPSRRNADRAEAKRKLATSQARVRELERQVDLLQSGQELEAAEPEALDPLPPAFGPPPARETSPASAAFIDDALPSPFRPLSSPPVTPPLDPAVPPLVNPPTTRPIPRETFGAAPKPADASPISGPYDDLQRISGIGPVIVSQLAELGVTTYRQIARFTDEDIERVGQHLDVFPDRVRREDWVSQAARLHRQTYGTQP